MAGEGNTSKQEETSEPHVALMRGWYVLCNNKYALL